MTRPDTEVKAHTVDTGCIHEGVQVQGIRTQAIVNEWAESGDLVLMGGMMVLLTP